MEYVINKSWQLSLGERFPSGLLVIGPSGSQRASGSVRRWLLLDQFFRHNILL